MADFGLQGYPQPFGSRKINVTTHQGPLLYVAGGETVNASTLGWGSFDRVSGSLSFNANNSGNYTVQVLYPVGQSPAVSANNVTGVPGVAGGGGSNTVKLKWVAANGSEAANNTNLSSEFARIEYIGG